MSSYFLFVQKNQIWTSPNVPFLPDFIPLHMSHPHQDFTPLLAHHPQRAYGTYPAVPYTPRRPHLTGNLFGRLQFKLHSLPITRVNGQWTLAPPLCSAWAELEKDLLRANTILQSSLSVRDLFIGFGIEGYRTPSQFGYQGLHKSKDDARHASWRSLHAFQVLAALTSMFIAIHLQKHPNPPATCPVWANVLEQGMQPTWIDDLVNSFVADFTIERAGVFLRANPDSPLRWQNQLPIMLSANVPVWIFWGVGTHAPLSDPAFAGFRPTPEQIARATIAPISVGTPTSVLRAYEDVELQWLPPLPPPPLFLPLRPIQSLPPPSPQQDSTCNPTFPDLPSGTSQLVGETMTDFFARRAESNRRIEELESPAQKSRRLAREESAKAAQKPSMSRRNSAMVFMWEEENGWWIRRQLGVHGVDAWWDAPCHRCDYDSFRQEWDIIPDDNANVDHEEEQEFFEGTLPPHHPEDDTDVIAHALLDIDAAVSFDLLLHQRYGIMCSNNDQSLLEPPEGDVRRKLAQAFNVLRDDIPEDPRLLSDILSFVKALIMDVTNPSAPATIWDISPTRRSPFVIRSPTMVVSIKTLNGRTYYFIRDSSSNAQGPWDLAVMDATTAVECLRMTEVTTVTSLVRLLSARGTPFNTFLRVPRDASFALLAPPVYYLGWRQKDRWRATVEEFERYSGERTAFLHQGRARAALLKGGILWRLAMEAMESPVCALEGPTDAVKRYGQVVRPASEDVMYVDDDLSENEMDFICGVYRVYTRVYISLQVSCYSPSFLFFRLSIENTGIQTELASWWPRHSVWQGSGLDVGYWSQGCELWYQKRLAGIKAGTAHPIGSIRWKSTLVYHKWTSKIFKATHNASANLLKSLSISDGNCGEARQAEGE